VGVLRPAAFGLTHAGTGSPLAQRSCACAVRERASVAASTMIERFVEGTRLVRPPRAARVATWFDLGMVVPVSGVWT
jgi:hypothetical protein